MGDTERTEGQARSGPGSEPRRGPSVNTVQIAAGGMAAVSSAVAASFLGVTGTIAGAALSSVLTATAGQVYQYYLDRTHAGLRRVIVTQVRPGLPVLREVLVAGGQPSAHRAEGRDSAATGDGADDVAGDVANEDSEEGADEGERQPLVQLARRGTRGRIALNIAASAVAVFVLAIGFITVFEALSGKPLSATVRGEDGSGLSLTKAAQTGDSGSTSGDQQTTSPSPQPTGATASPSEGSDSSASPDAESSSPSVEPTPTSEPSATPSQPAPQENPDAGTNLGGR